MHHSYSYGTTTTGRASRPQKRSKEPTPQASTAARAHQHTTTPLLCPGAGRQLALDPSIPPGRPPYISSAPGGYFAQRPSPRARTRVRPARAAEAVAAGGPQTI
ncbi:hypothetical protein ZWY2020_030959 [Hordeum vulgare]|nr:hypothetical protein ZWY2020_030959 [Hordeum vulgare]